MGDSHARILFVFTPGSPGMERFFERSAELPKEIRMADAFKTLSSEVGMKFSVLRSRDLILRRKAYRPNRAEAMGAGDRASCRSAPEVARLAAANERSSSAGARQELRRKGQRAVDPTR